MATQVVYHPDTEAAEARDTLLMFGGISLLVFGAGLVLTSPIVRRYLGNVNLGGLMHAAVPDIDRYLKMRAM